MRVVAGGLGLANIAGAILYFSPDWRWLTETAIVTVSLLWFAFFPRALLHKYWLGAGIFALSGLAVIVSEVRTALSVTNLDDLFPVWGPMALGGIFVAMLVEVGVIKRDGNKHA